MDACFGFVILVLKNSTPSLIKSYLSYCEKEKEAELQRQNPELWAQREMLKLQKERLAAEKQLAEERARQEERRQNAGAVAGLGRFMGWW